MRNQTSFLKSGQSKGLVLLVSSLFLLLLITTSQALAQSIIWTAKAPMPTPRIDFGAAVVNDKIYAIGGFSGTTLALVEEYDPSNDSWTRKADMPTARRLLVVTTVDNKIYAIGGMNFTNPNNVTYSNATEEYDPLTDTWTPKADIPIPPPVNNVLGNLFIGGTSASGKIYVVIFHSTIPGFTATYEYDPIADVWDTSLSPVPFSQVRFSAVSLNDKIYVLAANDFPVAGGAQLAEYNPSTDLWMIKPSTATSRRFLGFAATATKLYAIGGMEKTSPFSVVATVEEFDLSTNQWVIRTPMPTARHSAGLATIDGKIYVMGGADAASVPLPVMEEGLVQSLPPGGPLTIFPPSSIVTTLTAFDLTIILRAPGLSIVGAHATFDGFDVLDVLVDCVTPGTLISGGQTFRCPGLNGELLGIGIHTFSLTLDLSDGSSVSDNVIWEVLSNTEP
jgi:N-acetylneuraminic acid mutarotase